MMVLRHRSVVFLLAIKCASQHALIRVSAFSSSPSSPKRKEVTVVGGGISGLVVAHVLQQSEQYHVTLLEQDEDGIGGNIRSKMDPSHPDHQLNIGHATHLGMFWNLRLMLRHFGIAERPVGRGDSSTQGLFRMQSITSPDGRIYQPPLEDVTSLRTWWESLVFYYHSYQTPTMSLRDFLQVHTFSKRFLDILYWSMATFEFDKTIKEMEDYAVGTARVLMITQVFFQFLLNSAFEGVLPNKLQVGLFADLVQRSSSVNAASSTERLHELAYELGSTTPLASYLTANYPLAMECLAQGIGDVRTGCVFMAAEVASVASFGNVENAFPNSYGRLPARYEDEKY